MDEKETMTATFEPTLDVRKLIEGEPTEYIVVNPIVIEARFKSGEVRRSPQEIRERVVRCRDCVYLEQGPEGLFGCRKFLVASDYRADIPPSFCPHPNGFCAWGEDRNDD